MVPCQAQRVDESQQAEALCNYQGDEPANNGIRKAQRC